MKKTKGITLTSLVITIIVMLILTGATIAIVTADGKILQNANDVKLLHEIARNGGKS